MQAATYIFDTLNNKFPCEGPRVVRCICDFSTAGTFDIDLKALQQQAKISEIQSLFVDNGDNADPLILTMSVQNQRVIIPAYSQAYLTVLLNQPQFSATTASTAIVNIFAQNFPVHNSVWAGSSSSLNAPSVSVNNFPALQAVALNPGSSNTFAPQFPGVNIVTGAASVNTAITVLLGQNIRVFNSGAVAVAFRYGTGAQTAVAADLILAPNESILVNGNSADNLAAISPAGAGSINVTIGYGGLSA